jgi:hypothetical protein
MGKAVLLNKIMLLASFKFKLLSFILGVIVTF